MMKILVPIAVLLALASFMQPALAQEDDPPWEWTEERIERAVNKVRAGRDLTPDTIPLGCLPWMIWQSRFGSIVRLGKAPDMQGRAK